ncbi:MAG: FAD-binding oxidoreductase ['Candidatus Kapabacteria' thiocyanatum]|uniref:D-lactate dehydrogenase (cytochrome) n=1 Tax=Candidatus Kapaibacterium thiocyanatum TaxID=1895771 RepID=A0A1M3L2B4_9BACT|nr:FAD-binding oxidoreductase ['Candidatus Kapabacteria' thiocyanatum]OJX59301.1 MAG: hypothetical protein BGO89_02470 ['Candidatus Kapabacteria' thiocyanatum]
MAYTISERLTDRLKFAHDASLYRLVPRAVVQPRSADDVRELLLQCGRTGQHLTFRAAGTSLSGQAVTDGILVDLSQHFKRCAVEDDGRLLRVEPGVRGGMANAVLRSYGRKIGPDPASIMACMIGGIVANNASGMCCGTEQNSYHTIDSLTYMLADGTRIRTADPDADAVLRKEAATVHEGIAALRDEIRTDTAMTDRIRSKYRIKNTVGYSLNAFLDEDEPARILGRLMVGSEGTLGFIEEVVFRTVADPRHKITSILLFADLDDACAAITPLRDAGAAAVELMDDASLFSIRRLADVPDAVRGAERGNAALLVEFMAETESEASTSMTTARELTANLPLRRPAEWTTDPAIQASYWKVRKGLMPSIGAMRPAGTTMINEDIAVPPIHLADLVRAVHAAFDRHGYREAIIFGHAKDGNIHFVVNQRFETADDVNQYRRFMEDIARIVVNDYGGSLKAEHGTGRNMTPFVEMEWGTQAYGLMWRLKKLVDPRHILNPGVILDTDADAYVRNIKPVPSVDPETDRCIECGFCEHVCPSREVTLTPRQRIVLRREEVIEPALRGPIRRAYRYDGIDTCATDGMCATVCPVGIDTGSMIKRLRGERAGSGITMRFLARNFDIVDAASRIAQTIAHGTAAAIGADAVESMTAAINSDYRGFPTWHRHLGRPTPIGSGEPTTVDIWLMPACGSRWMGTREDRTSLVDLHIELARRAGLRAAVVPGCTTMCCGQVFSSRGHDDAASIVAERTMERLSVLSDGRIPVVVDASTCAATIEGMTSEHDVDLLDPIRFLATYILPTIAITEPLDRVVLHPGCGTAHLGAGGLMRSIAARCARNVVIPTSSTCCGMAGDRGLHYPELVKSAIAEMSREIDAIDGGIDGYYGVNVTCEAALHHHTGRHFEPLAALVERVTRQERNT